ncbi:EAL and HDOD domain-containing protein [Aromatoleum diolicum]|uniref:EAL domain-containing protein n=1 Tax=Aromatoleum diolicum TaxID=75796 RepID=A0ABX1Q9Z2_9RHOO|nr:EAL domain-containing protein [Aromatoleum diolicum]NMG74207.1 EAL domain-containing protein [Aromatoleum diolicum]
MAQESSITIIARQPIVDRRLHVVAYELLFRSHAGCNTIDNIDSASATVVVRDALRNVGMSTIVGDCTAFINVDGPTLLSPAIEALPPERVVFELLETIEVDESILKRCRELKRRGYRLALDDFVSYDEAYEPLLEIVDIVKLDVLQLSAECLSRLVRHLRSWPPKLLAEKVETPQGARTCFDLGFSFFQGFYFGRPAAMQV